MLLAEQQLTNRSVDKTFFLNTPPEALWACKNQWGWGVHRRATYYNPLERLDHESFPEAS